jgi:adenine-specific DNA methylase
MKKRFIEWDLPLAEISEESAREKNIRHGHPSTLHVWWARRPLSSSRITNFSALIDLPEDKTKRKEILQIIKNISPWESVKDGNDNNIKKAQQLIKEQWADQAPKILDPFSGGGSIPLEAVRLGCETYINDYNPVAVFIEKATIEWPQKFGIMIPRPDKKSGIDGNVEKVNFLVYMVEKWTNTILNQVKNEIGDLYPNKDDGSIPVGYIWARTIPCQNPNCGIKIPLVRQFWLSKKPNKKIAYKPVINESQKTIDFKIINDHMGDFDPSEGTISRGNAICPICGQVTGVKKIRILAQNGKMGERLVIIVNRHPNRIGKTYSLASKSDFDIFNLIEEKLLKKENNWKWLEKPIPDEELPLMSGVFNVPLYGIDNWGKLFNTRQKLSLITFLEKIKLAYEDIKNDCKRIGIEKYKLDPEEATNAIVGFLGIVLDMHAAFNNKNARWDNTSEAIKHLFGRQALGMMWDYVEVSPFSGSSGTPTSGLKYYKKNIEFASPDSLIGSVHLSNTTATSLPYPDNYFDAIFTDPPYYNNVPYADLSDFFYVWLKRSVGDLFPELFSTPLSPKSLEICEMSGWDSRRYKEKDDKFFEKELSNSFKEIYRVLKPEGIATIVYAHKTTKGWETILNSLVNAGLVVTASWPIHTEMKARLRAASSAALASSIYLVCRKKIRQQVGFYSEIQPLIKERVETKLQQFWNSGIAGGDFFISAIGPGMEIFSQYEKVEKLSGEQVTTVELLDYIRTVSTDFIVARLLQNSSSANIDNESDFYLAYRWTYLDNTVEYDDARKLASSSGVNLEKLWIGNGFVKKSGSKISLLGPKERDKIETAHNMVDVMHKSLQLWERGEKVKLAQLLNSTGHEKNPAFKQFCQAIAESLLNGNKEKQLLEGFLIGIDSYQKVKVKIGKDQTDLSQYGGV